jgi:hypothetical protein
MTQSLKMISLALGAALSMAVGCATAVRLDANFDSDPPGARPVSPPPPTPPNDSLTWTTQRPLTSTVVTEVAGRSVRVQPLPAFIAAPDSRQLIVIASTEGLSTSPPARVRGRLGLRLVGLGTVLVAFQPKQGGRLGDLVGGIELHNGLGGTGAPAPPGEVHVVRGFRPERIDDIFSLPTGGALGTVPPGTMVSVSFSFDQSAHTFSAGAPGAAQSIPYSLPSASPFEQILIYVWLQNPTSSTRASIDDVFVEEY